MRIIEKKLINKFKIMKWNEKNLRWMKKIKVIIKKEKREGKELESSGRVREWVRRNEVRCDKTYVAVLLHNNTVYLHDTISRHTTHSIVEYDIVLKSIM